MLKDIDFIRLNLINNSILSGISEKRQLSAELLFDFFQQLIIKTKPKYFFEIGAFDAKFSRETKLKIPECNFCAFEANPYNFDLFKNSVERDGVNYIHSAIGSYTGEVEFNLQNNINGQNINMVRGNNSILKRMQSNVDYTEVIVPINTIDGLFSDAILPNETLAMWIDVEGYAHEVLHGAIESLVKTTMVFIEVEDFSYWKKQKLAIDVIELMMSNGFMPVARDFEYEGQYNLIFLKRPVFQMPEVQEELIKYYSKVKSC